MTSETEAGKTASQDRDEARRRKLAEAAERALAEAKARQEAAAKAEEKAARPEELNGPSGPEPARYGDWERKGKAVDF